MLVHTRELESENLCHLLNGRHFDFRYPDNFSYPDTYNFWGTQSCLDNRGCTVAVICSTDQTIKLLRNLHAVHAQLLSLDKQKLKGAGPRPRTNFCLVARDLYLRNYF